MTDLNITELATRTSYLVGNTAQSEFSVNFPFFDVRDINVYVDGTLQGLTTDYAITTTPADDGGFLSGTVTFNEGQTDCTIAIVRNIKKERLTDFPPSGGFNIRELNRQLDQLTAVSQDLQRKIDQKIGFKETDFDDDVVVVGETAANRANKYIGFDNTGKMIVVKEGSTTGTAGAVDDTKVPKSRLINTGVGLRGGSSLNDDLSLRLSDITEEHQEITTSPEGQYSNANITVDPQGRIKAASDGVAGGGGGGIVITTPAGGGLGGGHQSGQPSNSLELHIRQQDELMNSPDGVGDYHNPKKITVNSHGIITSIEDGGPVNDAKENISVTGDQTQGLTGGGPLSEPGGPKIQMPILHPTASDTPAGTHVESTVYNNASIQVDRFGKVTQVSAGSVPGIAWTDMSQPITVNGTPQLVDTSGGVDSSIALQAHCDALPAQGGVLYFPTGTYRCDNKLTITGKPVVIMGDGIDVTRIKFNSINGGFYINLAGDHADNHPSPGHPPVADGYETTIRDMTIHTTEQGDGNPTNIAIKITNEFTRGVNDPSVLIDRLHITGSLPSAYWYTGIHLINCPHAKMSNIYISGEVNDRNGSPTTNTDRPGSEHGIYITTYDSATETHVSDSQIFFCKEGIKLDDVQYNPDNPDQVGWQPGITEFDDAEGLYINGVGMVACYYGIHSDQKNTFLGLQCINCHFSNQMSNIIGYYSQLFVNNNLLYNRPESPANNASIHVKSEGYQGRHSPIASEVSQMTSFIITNNIFVNVADTNEGTTIDGLGIIIGDGIIPPRTSFGDIPWIEQIRGVNISNNHFQWKGSLMCISIRDQVLSHTLSHNSFDHYGVGTPNLYQNLSTRNPRCTTGRKAVMNLPAGAELYDHHSNAVVTQISGDPPTIHVGGRFITTYDTDGFAANPTTTYGRLTIPSNNSIKWVRVGASVVLTTLSSSPVIGPSHVRIVHFNGSGVAYGFDKNGGGTLEDYASSWGSQTGYSTTGASFGGCAMATGTNNVGPHHAAGMNAVSDLVRVYDGDYFEVRFGTTSGNNVVPEPNAQFWIEIVEGL